MEESLKSFLKGGKDWERKRTTVPGIFVLKLPTYRGSPPRLAVEVNPVDEEGKPTKRRGLVLRSPDEFETFRRLVNEEKLGELLGVVGRVNPPKEKKAREGEEVLEI